jgi:hypothetical protein
MKKQDANSLATGRAESEMFSLSLTPLSVGKAMCAVIGATLPRLVPSSDSLDVIWTPTKVVDVRNAPANSKSGEEKDNSKPRNICTSYAQIEIQTGLDRDTGVYKAISYL